MVSLSSILPLSLADPRWGPGALIERRGFPLELGGDPRDAGADRHLSIIALTARALAGHRDRCLAPGMDGNVTRPVSAEDLARVMGERLQVSPARAG